MQVSGKITKAFMSLAFALLLLFPLISSAEAALLNFDSVDASSGNVDATSYLASYGVTLTNNSPGTNVYIVDYRKFFDVVPPSLPNFITQMGSNDPVSYTLTFVTPLTSVGFTRTRLVDPTGLAYPEWQVQVFNAAGAPGPSVGDYLRGYYGDNPAVTYTLTIPGDFIKSVQVYSNNYHFAGMSAVTLDDFQGSPVPVPPALLLLSSGLAAMGVLRGRLK